LAFHLVLIAFISTTAFTGQRLTRWTTGLMAVLMCMVGIMFPDHTSSPGAIGGVLLLVWGALFVVLGLRQGSSENEAASELNTSVEQAPKR
jgi:Ca2+/Na+ antiporter